MPVLDEEEEQKNLKIHIAHQNLRVLRYNLAYSRNRLEDWHQYYDSELAKYYREVKEGKVSMSRTQFDMALLQAQKRLIENIRKEEDSIEKAEKRLKDLDPNHHFSAQFSDMDDGAAPPFLGPTSGDDRMPEMLEDVVHTDHDRINDWLESVEPSTAEDFDNNEADDWAVRSVGVGSSVTIYAAGRLRKTIDAHRQMCLAAQNATTRRRSLGSSPIQEERAAKRRRLDSNVE